MPPGVHKRLLFFFRCPSCSFESSYSHPTGPLWRNPLFWCESCGRYSRQRLPGFFSTLWGVVAGLVIAGIWFGPFHSFYFSNEAPVRFLAPLAGLAVALVLWPIF